MRYKIILLFLLLSSVLGAQIRTGADRTEEYLSMLEAKKVAILANHTSLINGTHLVDTLLTLGVDIVKVFGPEHGFRGTSADGAKIEDETDPVTGIPVVSLYGKKRKPDSVDMQGIDLVIFDIQDVGLRFYTYISSMQYMMEACAENDIEFLVLDRPNPNGFFIDGPVLEAGFESFVGMQQIPVVHGMTVAEYAFMLNEEGLLADSLRCKLSWIKTEGWDHSKVWHLPVAPSPNLPDMTAIYLYPSLCFFEGTVVSLGRGTDRPFTKYGHPDYPLKDYSFTPVAKPGFSNNPKFKDTPCYGVDLGSLEEHFFRDNSSIILYWLVDAYQQLGSKNNFFKPYFSKLAGTDKLQEQIEQGVNPITIRAGWQKDIKTFKQIRKKYLLYKDFE